MVQMSDGDITGAEMCQENVMGSFGLYDLRRDDCYQLKVRTVLEMTV